MASVGFYDIVATRPRLTTSRRCWSVLFVLTWLTLAPGSASAHRLGEGYIILKVGNESISGRIELNLEDIGDALELDKDSDVVIDEAVLTAAMPKLRGYVGPRVRIGHNDTWWQIKYNGHSRASYPLGNYVVLPFVVEDPGTVPDIIQIDYRLLFDHDDSQKGLLIIEENLRIGFTNQDEAVSQLFNADYPVQDVDLTKIPTQNMLLLFVKEGIWHIWIGLDHILFLVALLLPSVRAREQPWWEPVGDFKSALWGVLKVVTLFTVAHSITLALASLRIVTLPGFIVESIIAASIVIAAVDNIRPIFGRRIGWIVFGFGLFHGLGFASVLSHLTLSQASLVTTLLGFNVGVEIGQVVIIAAVFPILFALRKAKWYPNGVQRGLSVLLIALGSAWMIERLFDVTIVGF